MTTTATTAQRDLATVIHHWRDLNDALGTPGKTTWFGTGLRSYLAALDDQQAEAEHTRALALRLLERDPTQLGQRPIPLRVTVLDTMQAVHADLLECADAIAELVQRDPMKPPPAKRAAVAHTWEERRAWQDHARQHEAALRDRNDPRRWKWTGQRPAAPYAALWLLGRVQGSPGPFRPLTDQQREQIAGVARSCAQRVEKALDIAAEIAPITKPCPDCEGPIELHGGAGAPPVARCTDCGRTWGAADAA